MEGEILNKLAEAVQKHFGDGTQVKVGTIIRNNGCVHSTLDISMSKPERLCRAVVDTIVASIEKGDISFGEAALSIAEEYKKDDLVGIVDGDVVPLCKSYILSNVRYRLVNYEKNAGMLESVPHVPYLNLAAMFYCDILHESGRELDFCINSAVMEMYEITMDELNSAARENTLAAGGFRIMSMKQALAQLSNGELLGGSDAELDVAALSEESGLFIVANSSGLFGANVLMYPEVFREFAELKGSDLYIIPSSVHEVLMIPADIDCVQPSQLKELVCTTNAEEVKPEEVLADCVYFYSREKGSISLL